MKRANLDIDNKVLAGLIVGALTYALTKLAIPVDPQVEQLINVSAALIAAYLVPSKLPAALTAEAAEADDVPDPPSALEAEFMARDLATTQPAFADDGYDANAMHVYRTSDQAAGTPSDAVDERAHYGGVNQVTGLTAAEVETELDLEALSDTDDEE